MKYHLKKVKLPLFNPWKLSRNTSLEKTNYLFIREVNGQFFPGEIAPNIRFNETPELIEAEFAQFLEGKREGFSSAFKCGVQMSDWFYQNRDCLNPDASALTSFSMAIMEPNKIEQYLKDHSQFRTFKMKVDKESARDSIKEYFKHTNKNLRIDGNEAWKDPSEVMKIVEEFKSYPIEMLEQPFPEGEDDCLVELKNKIPFDLIADESFQLGDENIEEIKLKYDGVNLKMMKTTGPQRLLELVDLIKSHKLKLMLGCMIESSVGIYCGTQLSHHFDYLDLDGSLLVKEPFGLIEERDGLVYCKGSFSFLF